MAFLACYCIKICRSSKKNHKATEELIGQWSFSKVRILSLKDKREGIKKNMVYLMEIVHGLVTSGRHRSTRWIIILIMFALALAGDGALQEVVN